MSIVARLRQPAYKRSRAPVPHRQTSLRHPLPVHRLNPLAQDLKDSEDPLRT